MASRNVISKQRLGSGIIKQI